MPSPQPSPSQQIAQMLAEVRQISQQVAEMQRQADVLRSTAAEVIQSSQPELK